jgi:hypothetical protein
MRTSLFYLLILFLIACQGSNESPEAGNDAATDSNTSTPDSTVPVTTGEACFRKIMARDTFSIKIAQSGNAVSGTLSFDNYQKDSSKGTVKGSSSGDTLKLWYDFTSEGMNSVMEIYFKRVGDKLVRGIGTMDVKGDTSYFSNPSDIKFEEKDAWNKIACDQ